MMNKRNILLRVCKTNIINLKFNSSDFTSGDKAKCRRNSKYVKIIFFFFFVFICVCGHVCDVRIQVLINTGD